MLPGAISTVWSGPQNCLKGLGGGDLFVFGAGHICDWVGLQWACPRVTAAAYQKEATASVERSVAEASLSE